MIITIVIILMIMMIRGRPIGRCTIYNVSI